MIAFKCWCGRGYNVPDKHAAQVAECTRCTAMLMIPKEKVSVPGMDLQSRLPRLYGVTYKQYQQTVRKGGKVVPQLITDAAPSEKQAVTELEQQKRSLPRFWIAAAVVVVLSLPVGYLAWTTMAGEDDKTAFAEAQAQAQSAAGEKDYPRAIAAFEKYLTEHHGKSVAEAKAQQTQLAQLAFDAAQVAASEKIGAADYEAAMSIYDGFAKTYEKWPLAKPCVDKARAQVAAELPARIDDREFAKVSTEKIPADAHEASKAIAALNDYRQKYPNGRHFGEAANQIAAIDAEQAAITADSEALRQALAPKKTDERRKLLRDYVAGEKSRHKDVAKTAIRECDAEEEFEITSGNAERLVTEKKFAEARDVFDAFGKKWSDTKAAGDLPRKINGIEQKAYEYALAVLAQDDFAAGYQEYTRFDPLGQGAHRKELDQKFNAKKAEVAARRGREKQDAEERKFKIVFEERRKEADELARINLYDRAIELLKEIDQMPGKGPLKDEFAKTLSSHERNRDVFFAPVMNEFTKDQHQWNAAKLLKEARKLRTQLSRAKPEEAPHVLGEMRKKYQQILDKFNGTEAAREAKDENRDKPEHVLNGFHADVKQAQELLAQKSLKENLQSNEPVQRWNAWETLTYIEALVPGTGPDMDAGNQKLRLRGKDKGDTAREIRESVAKYIVRKWDDDKAKKYEGTHRGKPQEMTGAEVIRRALTTLVLDSQKEDARTENELRALRLFEWLREDKQTQMKESAEILALNKVYQELLQGAAYKNTVVSQVVSVAPFYGNFLEKVKALSEFRAPLNDTTGAGEKPSDRRAKKEENARKSCREQFQTALNYAQNEQAPEAEKQIVLDGLAAAKTFFPDVGLDDTQRGLLVAFHSAAVKAIKDGDRKKAVEQLRNALISVEEKNKP